jgi:hypothetical protein
MLSLKISSRLDTSSCVFNKRRHSSRYIGIGNEANWGNPRRAFMSVEESLASAAVKAERAWLIRFVDMLSEKRVAVLAPYFPDVDEDRRQECCADAVQAVSGLTPNSPPEDFARVAEPLDLLIQAAKEASEVNVGNFPPCLIPGATLVEALIKLGKELADAGDLLAPALTPAKI